MPPLLFANYIGAETAVVGVSSLGVLTAVFSILRIKSPGRVLDTDLKGYVKQMMTSGGMGSALPKTPNIDFSKFGETQTLALSRINKLSDSSNEALKRG
jgi:hypothetical protein